MGVLDDAIRQHLELKRSHGAAEEELRRQEEEALGPARREVAPTETGDGDGTGAQVPAEVGAAETAHAEQGSLPEADVAHDAEVAHGGEAAIAEQPALDEQPVADEEPALQEPEPGSLPEEPLAPQDEVEAEHDEHDDERVGQTPPRGFPAVHEDDELVADEEDNLGEEGDDPDVLEDTPDFLQETPEHDRLWFEQKPPRDFDFE